MILDTINALEALRTTASLLLKKCKEAADHPQNETRSTLPPKKRRHGDAMSVLEEKLAEVDHLRAQASNLLKKAKGARALVHMLVDLRHQDLANMHRLRIFSN